MQPNLSHEDEAWQSHRENTQLWPPYQEEDQKKEWFGDEEEGLKC